MMSIGQEAAAQVIKFLSQQEVTLLAMAMTRASGVPKEAVTSAFQEFVDLMARERPIGSNAEDYVSGVLEKALGPDKAARLVERLRQGNYSSGIESVKRQDPHALAEMLRAEHPQVVAALFADLGSAPLPSAASRPQPSCSIASAPRARSTFSACSAKSIPNWPRPSARTCSFSKTCWVSTIAICRSCCARSIRTCWFRR